MRTVLSIVLLFFIGSVWALPCVNSDDPFGAGLEAHSPFIPRKAVYLAGAKKRELKIKNELMIRSLPLSPGAFENMFLVISKRDLTDLPHTKPGDIVYDLSEFFPNCDLKKDLWVMYNASSSYIIASVDPLLRASVNEFVYNHSVEQIMKMRLSVAYLHIEGNVPLEIEAIKNSEYQRIMNISGEFRSGEEASLTNSGGSLQLELVMSEDGFYADAVIKLEEREEEKSMLTATFEFGKEYILELGVNEGNSRGVLILRLEDLDVCGREVELRAPLAERINLSKQIFYDWRCHYCPYDLDLDIFSAGPSDDDPINLVVPPRDPLFRRNDVVYDLKEAMVLQGIEMGLGDKLLYNKTCGQIFGLCSYEYYEQIQELFSIGREPSTLLLSASIFEVDSAQLPETQWTLESVLASHPILLGNAGSTSRSGEKTSLASHYGTFTWEPIMGESGYHISNILDMDLTLQGRKIKVSKEEFVTREERIFIELKRDPEKNKTYVMMMKIQIERIGHFEKLHNRK